MKMPSSARGYESSNGTAARRLVAGAWRRLSAQEPALMATAPVVRWATPRLAGRTRGSPRRRPSRRATALFRLPSVHGSNASSTTSAAVLNSSLSQRTLSGPSPRLTRTVSGVALRGPRGRGARTALPGGVHPGGEGGQGARSGFGKGGPHAASKAAPRGNPKPSGFPAADHPTPMMSPGTYVISTTTQSRIRRNGNAQR